MGIPYIALIKSNHPRHRYHIYDIRNLPPAGNPYADKQMNLPLRNPFNGSQRALMNAHSATGFCFLLWVLVGVFGLQISLWGFVGVWVLYAPLSVSAHTVSERGMARL